MWIDLRDIYRILCVVIIVTYLYKNRERIQRRLGQLWRAFWVLVPLINPPNVRHVIAFLRDHYEQYQQREPELSVAKDFRRRFVLISYLYHNTPYQLLLPVDRKQSGVMSNLKLEFVFGDEIEILNPQPGVFVPLNPKMIGAEEIRTTDQLGNVQTYKGEEIVGYGIGSTQHQTDTAETP